MMTSYGLTGETTASNTPHKYCPRITDNCCTVSDAETSMTIWKTEYQPKIERYYEVYLYSLKYLLGFSTEIKSLAEEFQSSSNSRCKASATALMKMNLSPKITADVYHAFSVSLEKMGEVRRGFYCALCDGGAQKQLSDYLAIVNLFYSDRIYYSKSFCQKLVDSTIRASYFAVNFLKPYAEDAASLINCKSGNSTSLVYDIDFWTRQQVKNCYYYKNKYFFFFCEGYCEKFHLVKPSDILDGDLKQLKKFVSHFMQNRAKVFRNPDLNLLMDGVTYEEDYLKEYMDQMLGVDVFMKASVSNVQLDKFETDVVYSGGMDPLESLGNNTYPLTLAGVNALALAAALWSLVAM